MAKIPKILLMVMGKATEIIIMLILVLHSHGTVNDFREKTDQFKQSMMTMNNLLIDLLHSQQPMLNDTTCTSAAIQQT